MEGSEKLRDLPEVTQQVSGWPVFNLRERGSRTHHLFFRECFLGQEPVSLKAMLEFAGSCCSKSQVGREGSGFGLRILRGKGSRGRAARGQR